MPRTTIKVKRLWNDKKTKVGKPFTKLLGQDSKYYTLFFNSSIVESIREGSTIEIEAEPGSMENYYNIKKLISVADLEQYPVPYTKPAQKVAGSMEGATSAPASTDAGFDIDANLEEAVAKAKRQLAETPELVEVSQGLIAELAREGFDIWMNGQIRAMDIKKIKAYGKVD